jgi:hypothetical protein
MIVNADIVALDFTDETIAMCADPPVSPCRGFVGEQRYIRTALGAQLFNGDGVPQQGITIRFVPDGGSVDPQTQVTDGSGRAQTLLTVVDNDREETVTVTAQSGVVDEALELRKIPFELNEAPVAQINPVPIQNGLAGESVVFDGSNSSDPDGTITMYRWTISSSDPDPGKPETEIIEEPGALSVQRIYELPQRLTVTLEVTDNPSAPDLLAQGQPITYDDLSSISYEITCNNPPPTAVIGGSETIDLILPPGNTQSIWLDGTLSFDGQTAIDKWVWGCGSEFPALPQDGAGSIVTCKYRGQSEERVYTVTLDVTDRGTGEIDPATGTWECQGRSEEPDRVVVTVRPPQ